METQVSEISSSSSTTITTSSSVSKEFVGGEFTRLIESEKFQNFQNSSDLMETEEDEDSELNFIPSTSTSPQPQPDLLINLNDNNNINFWNHETKSESVVETKKKSKSSSRKSSVDVITTEVSKLKSLYSNTANEDGSGDHYHPQNNKINNNSLTTEARVFAKVCVANLRRSFGDLTIFDDNHDETDNNHNNDSSRQFRSLSSDLSCKNFQSTGPKSLVILTSDSSVSRLKSSFSKFDKLSRSNSTKSSTVNNEQVVGTPPVIEKTCKACGKEVFLVELMKAEKASWHRNCFRCFTCQKQLSVDTYSSNEGKLYCKPHFKQLFQPKAVFDQEEDSNNKKPEVIIRESQPAELPPDVVRASEKALTGLEDIEVDVRSKFEMFENFKQNEANATSNTPVKRSGSVLSSRLLARYEGKEGEQGVPNDEIHGDLENYSDEEEIDESGDNNEHKKKVKNPLAAINEIIQCKQMEQIRGKWEVGMNNNKEEISENRKAELAKFRSRLCQGKSNTLKDLYEKGVPANDESKPTTQQPIELDEFRQEKAKKFREMFEKGQVTNENQDSDNEAEREKQSIVERDSLVFQSEVAKQSRSLFREMDNNLSSVSLPTTPITPEIHRAPSIHNKVNLFQNVVGGGGEVVRSSDKKQEDLPVVEDLTNKFKFFETYEKNQQENKLNDKKTFRMTPPPNQTPSEESETPLAYVDPEIIRSSPTAPLEEEQIVKSRTTSKMLNVFRQLEEQQNKKEICPRPLKQFTPPREPARVEESSDEGDEEIDDEEFEDENDESIDKEKDAFLKEVGSLARARSLRARFERWEAEENTKNAPVSAPAEFSDETIESARNLKQKFEQIQLQQQQQQQQKQKHNVRRFVELQNTDGNMSGDECAFCNKKVYVMEKVEANSKTYHKNCFRCSVCKSIMRMDSFTFHHGALYCKNHFKQLFKIKGNYDEGFGHETQKQIFARKQAEKENQ